MGVAVCADDFTMFLVAYISGYAAMCFLNDGNCGACKE